MGKEGGNLGDKMKALVPALAGVAAGFLSFKAIEGAIDKTQELGEATLKLEQQTGLTAKSSSELISVFEHFGLSTDSAGKSLGIFAKNLTVSYEQTLGFSSSASTFTKTMDSLGVATLDTSNKMRPLQDVLLDVADKFHGMQDGAEKTGVAMQLFGKSGKDLIPILDQGSTGIKELEAEADKLGVTLTDKNVAAIHNYTVSQREMNEAVNGLKLQIGVELMPVLTKFADWFVDHQEMFRTFFSDALKTIEDFANQGIKGIKVITDGLQWIPDHQSDISHAIELIGAAILLNLGPESKAALAILYLVNSLGKLHGGGFHDEIPTDEIGRLQYNRDQLQKSIDEAEKEQSNGGKGSIPNLFGIPFTGSILSKIAGSDYTKMATTVPGGTESMTGTSPDGNVTWSGSTKLNDLYAQKDANAQALIDAYAKVGVAANDATPPVVDLGGAEGLGSLPPAATKAGKSAQELAKEVEDAMSSVADSVNSAMSDGSISFSEMSDINKNIDKQNEKLAEDHLELLNHVTVQSVAATEAAAQLADSQSKTDEMTFTLTKTMDKFNLVMKDSKQAADQLTSALSKQALQALQTAAASLFQHPTAEQATLNLQLAEAQNRIANFAAGGATDDQLAQQNALVAGIQKQIAVESARVALDQAQLDVADQTKITDKQQQDAVKGLIPLIRDQSTALQNNTQYLSDFGTLMVQAAQAVALFKSVVGNDATTFNDNVVQIIRQTALTGGFNGILVTPQQTGQ